MKRCALLLLLATSLLPAQEAARSVEPEEPDIVLPEVILRIQDLSVEEVEPGLAAEQELLAPERSIPLPAAEELAIEEPDLPFGIAESGDLFLLEKSSSLSAQAIVGAGNYSHLYSLVSLNRIGEEPRFKLRFLHEMMDGIAGQPAGSGFALREDSLEAGLKLHLGRLAFEAEGLYRDLEQGLQGASPYASRVHRRGALDLALEHPLGQRFSLGAEAAGSFSSQLLTGDPPQDTTEVLAEPVLKVEFRNRGLRLGLAGRYRYRGLLDGGGELQRGGVEAHFAAEFLDDFRFELRGGWAWADNPARHLFPFSVSLSGTPFSTFSFLASGGFRIQELDYADLLALYPLAALPAGPLADNYGWFGDLSLSFSLTRNLSLQTRAVLALNSALLLPERNPLTLPTGLDPATGLFPISQEERTTLSTEVRLRLNLGRQVTAGAVLQTELLERSRFTPLHRGSVEIEGTNASSRWGGGASLGFAVGYPPEETNLSLLPLLSVSGFYNITDTISLTAEVEDLLYPFGDGLRYSWYPYEQPGLRGTVKVRINL